MRKEHRSTETQIPVHPDTTDPEPRPVELDLPEKSTYTDLVPVIEKVLSDPDNAVVISSDLKPLLILWRKLRNETASAWRAWPKRRSPS